MKVHVLTAVTRPHNLARLAQSLGRACESGQVELVWHLRFDLERQHVGGQALKNRMLDEITDGWVWVLDDDTTAHPSLFAVTAALAVGDVEAVVVSQRRQDGRILEAKPENIRVGSIDVGQAVILRDAIGPERLPEHYEGDGVFLERVLTPNLPRVRFVPEVLSYHNALGG